MPSVVVKVFKICRRASQSLCKLHGGLVHRVPDTPGAEGVEYVPELKKFYKSNAGDNTIGVVDLKQMKVIKKLKTEAKPDGSTYAAPFHRLYVSDERGKAEAIVDVTKDEIIKTLHFDSETGMPQYDPVARKVYVNLQDQNIFAVNDPATDEGVGRYPVGHCKENHGMTLDPEHLPLLRRKRAYDRVRSRQESAHRVPTDGGRLRRHQIRPWTEANLRCPFERNHLGLPDDPDHYQKKVYSLAVDPETHRVYAPEQEAHGKAVARMVVYEAVINK
jgi:hypothetical protein